jgi:hypothetical protein
VSLLLVGVMRRHCAIEIPQEWKARAFVPARKGFEEHEASEHFAKFTKFNNEKQPYSKPQNVEFFTTIDCE